MLVSALVTFLVVILILYLINLLPLDGRAKQIVPRHRDHPRRDLAAEIHRGVLARDRLFRNKKAPAGAGAFISADRTKAISAS